VSRGEKGYGFIDTGVGKPILRRATWGMRVARGGLKEGARGLGADLQKKDGGQTRNPLIKHACLRWGSKCP